MSQKITNNLYRTQQFRQEAHLSFSGGGFLGIYHVGVLQAFKDFAPHISKRKVLGASAGALAATCLVCDFPVDKAIESISKMTVHCRSLTLGALHPRFNIFDIMRDDLREFLPPDAHLRANDKLFVSVTHATSLKNEIISKFDSRDELIDVLMASCFIPYFLGVVLPKIKGVCYIDGGISCNIPSLDIYTITVSPFHESGAVIRARKGNLPNVAFAPESALRLCKTVFAPPPSVLIELCQQGYDDAIHFLQTNNLIACHDCAIAEKRLLYALSEVGEEIVKPEKCRCCKHLIDASDKSKFSRILLNSMEEAAITEQLARQERPLMHTAFVRTLAILFAITVYPVHAALVLVIRTYDNWEHISNSLKLSFSSGRSSLGGYARRVWFRKNTGSAPGQIDDAQDRNLTHPCAQKELLHSTRKSKGHEM